MYSVVKVFHASPEIFNHSRFYKADGKIFNAERALENFAAGKYHAADMLMLDQVDDPIENLEAAFELTQNTDIDWHFPPCRSTEIGDIMITSGEIWIVGPYSIDRIGNV